MSIIEVTIQGVVTYVVRGSQANCTDKASAGKFTASYANRLARSIRKDLRGLAYSYVRLLP